MEETQYKIHYTGKVLDDQVRKLRNVDPDTFAWVVLESTSAKPIDIKTNLDLRVPGNYVLYHYTNGPADAPRPFSLMCRKDTSDDSILFYSNYNGGAYVCTPGSETGWTELLTGGTNIVKGTPLPPTPKVGDFFLDTDPNSPSPTLYHCVVEGTWAIVDAQDILHVGDYCAEGSVPGDLYAGVDHLISDLKEKEGIMLDGKPMPSGEILSIATDGTTLVAILAESKTAPVIMYSNNWGTNWLVASRIKANWQRVEYKDNRFFAFAALYPKLNWIQTQNTDMYISSNGSSWSKLITPNNEGSYYEPENTHAEIWKNQIFVYSVRGYYLVSKSLTDLTMERKSFLPEISGLHVETENYGMETLLRTKFTNKHYKMGSGWVSLFTYENKTSPNVISNKRIVQTPDKKPGWKFFYENTADNSLYCYKISSVAVGTDTKLTITLARFLDPKFTHTVTFEETITVGDLTHFGENAKMDFDLAAIIDKTGKFFLEVRAFERTSKKMVLTDAFCEYPLPYINKLFYQWKPIFETATTFAKPARLTFYPDVDVLSADGKPLYPAPSEFAMKRAGVLQDIPCAVVAESGFCPLKVETVSQESIFMKHINDHIVHITEEERTNWNGKLDPPVLTESVSTYHVNLIDYLGTHIPGDEDVAAMDVKVKKFESDLNGHLNNLDIHVTKEDKTNWNAKAASTHTHIRDNRVELDASKVTSGVVDLARINPKVFHKVYFLNSLAEIGTLDKTKVSRGDTLKDLQQGDLYFIKDPSLLPATTALYAISSMSSIKVDWLNVHGTPHLVQEFGITNLYTKNAFTQKAADALGQIKTYANTTTSTIGTIPGQSIDSGELTMKVVGRITDLIQAALPYEKLVGKNGVTYTLSKRVEQQDLDLKPLYQLKADCYSIMGL